MLRILGTIQIFNYIYKISFEKIKLSSHLTFVNHSMSEIFWKKLNISTTNEDSIIIKVHYDNNFSYNLKIQLYLQNSIWKNEVIVTSNFC